jgi:hypothetical protein
MVSFYLTRLIVYPLLPLMYFGMFCASCMKKLFSKSSVTHLIIKD